LQAVPDYFPIPDRVDDLIERVRRASPEPLGESVTRRREDFEPGQALVYHGRSVGGVEHDLLCGLGEVPSLKTFRAAEDRP